MFQLSIVDHIRLSFGHVVQNYTVHARTAERMAAVALHARTVILVLMGTATALSGAVLLGAGRYTQIGAVAAGATAFATYAIVAATGLEERLIAHRFCANRLWALCERYRALLAEIHDGLLERGTILARRDELIQQFHDVYEHASPLHHGARRHASRASGSGGGLTEEQIDQFLPASLRQTGEAAASAGASAPH